MQGPPLSRGCCLSSVPRLWIWNRIARVGCGVGLTPEERMIRAHRVHVRSGDEHVHEARVGAESASSIAVRTGEAAHLKIVLIDPDLVHKVLAHRAHSVRPTVLDAEPTGAAWGARRLPRRVGPPLYRDSSISPSSCSACRREPRRWWSSRSTCLMQASRKRCAKLPLVGSPCSPRSVRISSAASSNSSVTTLRFAPHQAAGFIDEARKSNELRPAAHARSSSTRRSRNAASMESR